MKYLDVLIMLCDLGFNYIASDADGTVFAYIGLPTKVDKGNGNGKWHTIWQSSVIAYNNNEFPCSWEDKEPLSIQEEIKRLKNGDTIYDETSTITDFMRQEMNEIISLYERKSKSYGAAADPFYNFRRTGERIFKKDDYNSMFLAAEVYKDKHNIALAKGIDVPECAERLRDNIVYSLLQLAMIEEANRE